MTNTEDTPKWDEECQRCGMTINLVGEKSPSKPEARKGRRFGGG